MEKSSARRAVNICVGPAPDLKAFRPAPVGIMIQECMAELGFQIVGPVCSASDALTAAKDDDFDAAILNINLGGGMVYRVAEILAWRHVAFVFVTGCDADSRYRKIPVLQIASAPECRSTGSENL